MGNGWHRGIICGVCLAAIMPAILATSRTLPFETWFVSIRYTVEGCIRMRALAMASRMVSGRSVTSTMWMLPLSSRWVRWVGMLDESVIVYVLSMYQESDIAIGWLCEYCIMYPKRSLN